MNRVFDALDNLLAFLLILGVAFAVLLGWGLNIYKLIEYHESVGWMLARAAGILVAPLGVILGYL